MMKSHLRSVLLSALFVILTGGMAYAQQKVSGTVKDVNGEPIIGATVAVKGTTNGTMSDVDGNWSLSVPAKSTLVASCIGYAEVEKPLAAGQKTVDFVLEEDSMFIEDAVVIGYGGIMSRRDLTGSVGSVSGTKLASVPVTSAAVALQGKVAGVQVTTVDGAPGADINIRVRGGTSVTQSNDPLYIVDGFQTDNINDIPPTDIASIDILKDASLTAIYGARGGNGVVIVTTKAALAGKVQVSVNAQMSVSKLSKKLDLMDTYNFVRYQYDWAAASSGRSSEAKYFRANFGNPQDLDVYKRAPTHDWQDEVLGETPLNYSTNVTVGGGTEKIRFNISLTQSEDKGIILGSGVRRTNLNTKFSATLNDKLTINFNPKFSFRRDTGAGAGSLGTGGLIDVLRYRPTNGLHEFAFWDPATVDPDDEKVFEYTNPKNDITENTRKKHSYSITNQVNVEWKPFKGFMFRSEGSIGLSFSDDNRFYGAMTSTGQANNKLPVATISRGQNEKFIWTNTATYGFDLYDLHNFSFLLGQEIQSSQSKSSYMANRYFPRAVNAEKAIDNMNLGTPYQATTSLSTADRTASFFGQANYNYDHKYLLSLTMRADGSTKFAPGEQWGYFPSVSGAWVASEEDFLKFNPVVSNLKVRAAIGKVGNNRIDNDMWRFLYTIASNGGPGFGEATELGEQYYYMGDGKTYPNTRIKWETTLTRNVAFDLGFFKNRLTVTPEFYWNTTSDLLYTSDVPTVSGYTRQIRNIGQVTSRGVELTVNGDILRGRDYVLSGNLSLGFNKRVIDKLNDTDDVIWDQNDRWKSSYNDYCIKVGDEVGLIYGFIYDGLYGFDEFDFDLAQNLLAIPKEGTIINKVSGSSNSGDPTLPGKIKFKDISGPDGEPDGVIDEYDRTVIGNTNPKFQGGFGFSGQWKNFDFSVNFNFMCDFDINNATAYQLSSSEGNNKKFYNVLNKFSENRWHYYNPETGDNYYKNYWIDNSLEIYKAANEGVTNWNPADVTNKVTHSYFIEDGSFLRCQDITVGYTLPQNIVKKAGLSRLRVYVSTTNLFILTNYSGYDPEVDIQTGLTCGMDYNRYPRNRSFVFGVNLTF